MKLYIILLLISFSVFSAADQQVDNKKPLLITTSTHLTDAARRIIGDKMDLHPMMAAGVDPHLYQATPKDIRNLAKADMILYLGLNFEARLAQVLAKMSHKHAYALGEAIEKKNLIKVADYANAYDPHVWFDINLWQVVIAEMGKKIIEFDPLNKSFYEKNLKNLLKEFDELDTFIKKEVHKLPKSQRVLVTQHDAFHYFARSYGFTVKSIQGISTLAKANLADIQALANYIAKQKLKAVFVESSSSDRGLRALKEAVEARNWNVKIGGSLFSDSLGGKGTKEESYFHAYKHNIRTIVKGLK